MNLTDPEWYLSRDIGTLRFQSRVLHEAFDRRNPLIERVTSLFYFTKNTDEFFMKRIGRLKQEMQVGITRKTIDGQLPRQRWEESTLLFRDDQRRMYELWNSEINPALAHYGVRIVSHDELDDQQKAKAREYFQSEILPTLTPLAFDPSHPFPFLSNLSVSIGMWVRQDDNPEDPVFTRVKVPDNRPAFFVARDEPGKWVGVTLADLIIGNLDLLLPECQVEAVSLFRITRSAEVEEEDEDMADDLLDYVRNLLEERRRGPAVRLEVEPGMPNSMRDLLRDQLSLNEEELIELPGKMIDFLGMVSLRDIGRNDLMYPTWTPQPHPRFVDEHDENATVFDRILENDILVHHPYHAFEQTTLRFLETAADDPKVISIKITIYRTDNDSKVLNALIRAARNGMQVAVLVELTARFDEHQNVRWVQRLEENGVHVSYGKYDQKTHTKIALVVREEDQGHVKLYSHIGTGNYHSGTAKGYTDLGLLTADEEIGQDLVKVFNMFTGPQHRSHFDRLLIAPLQMRDILIWHIEREISLAKEGKPARIVAKMNGLEHPEMVDCLYRAGQAGVQVDLIVRDICILRPGIAGLSETIRVHSIVGRFLEHSRIFYFGNGDTEPPDYYIGSADWMRRNLDNRTEAVTPVRFERHRKELRIVLETLLADNRRRWVMCSDGMYSQCIPWEGEPELDAQSILMERAAHGLFGEYGPMKEEILKRQPAERLR